MSVPEKYIKEIRIFRMKRKLKSPDYLGRKPTGHEWVLFTGIEGFGIDENPLFDKKLAMAQIQKRIDEYEARNHEKAKQQFEEEMREKMRNQPCCPTCGSYDIKKLDMVDRAISVEMFGLASNKINKSFKCKNCGYTW